MNIEKFNRAKEIDEEVRRWKDVLYVLNNAKEVKISVVPKDEDEWGGYHAVLADLVTLNDEQVQEVKDRIGVKIKSLENEFEEI